MNKSFKQTKRRMIQITLNSNKKNLFACRMIRRLRLFRYFYCATIFNYIFKPYTNYYFSTFKLYASVLFVVQQHMHTYIHTFTIIEKRTTWFFYWITKLKAKRRQAANEKLCGCVSTFFAQTYNYTDYTLRVGNWGGVNVGTLKLYTRTWTDHSSQNTADIMKYWFFQW